MKGLLLKDFSVLRTQGKTYIILLLIYSIFSIMSKNLSFFGGVISILCIMIPINTLAYDEKAGWESYALTMPVTRRDLVISKYLIGFILMIFCFVLTNIVNLIVGGDQMVDGAVSALALSAMGVFYLCLVLPFAFKLGVERARIIMVIILMIPVILLIGGQSIGIFSGINETNIKFIFMGGVLLMLLLMPLSIGLSIKWMDQREF